MTEELQRYLDALNPDQKAAVLANDKPLVVFAGAGSGKTRVITTKICYCIEELAIPSWKILAVTFTNKACKEMQERVSKMLDEQKAHDLCIKTFHSFGTMVLRRFGDRIGLNKNFKIYDDEDSLALLAQIFPDEKKTDLSPIMKKISICKDKLQMPSEFAYAPDKTFYNKYRAYQDALASTRNVDFADLILKTIELVQKDQDVRDWLHNRFRVILVDEYQDSNAAQCELLKLIVGPKTFVCVVGDDDQSIYRFRGAEVSNILQFNNYFSDAQIIKLGRNYRSTKSILNLASAVIEKNKARAPKKIYSEREEGKKPQLIYVDTDFSEATYVAAILEGDGKYENSAVLYRTNAQSATFETVFNRHRIPYKLVGALRFYDREEIKDVIAHISILLNPRDSVSFSRIINKPTRGLGPSSVEKLMDYSSSFQGDMIMTCKEALKGNLELRGTKGLSAFIEAYDNTLSMIGNCNNTLLIKAILEQFGITAYYKERDYKEKNLEDKRTKNIEQLVNIFSENEGYQDGSEGLNLFMEEVSLDPTMMANDNNRNQKGVSLITMHNTKGLEFDRVFIVGMEEGIFPWARCTESIEDLEEERRIFYVAITRAKNDLYIFSCRNRKLWGQYKAQFPSRFLSDFPKNLVFEKKDSKTTSTTNYTSNYKSSYTLPKDPPKTTATILKPTAPTIITKPILIKQTEVETGFKANDRIYNSAYGKGKINSIKEFGSRKILDVVFDDGRKASFVEGKADLKKIKD